MKYICSGTINSNFESCRSHLETYGLQCELLNLSGPKDFMKHELWNAKLDVVMYFHVLYVDWTIFVWKATNWIPQLHNHSSKLVKKQLSKLFKSDCTYWTFLKHKQRHDTTHHILNTRTQKKQHIFIERIARVPYCFFAGFCVDIDAQWTQPLL